MRSFDKMFRIYASCIGLNGQLIDELYEKYGMPFTQVLSKLINYFDQVSNEDDGDRTTIMDYPYPELFAFIMWCKIYMGQYVNIYETDDNLALGKQSYWKSEKLPIYAGQMFSETKYKAYITMCAIYAIYCANIPVLEQTLEGDALDSLDQQGVEVVINILLESDPDRHFLNFVKQNVIKDRKIKPNLIKSEFHHFIPILIDLDFQLDVSQIENMNRVKPEYWDHLMGLRDFPIFDQSKVRISSVYYQNAGGSLEKFKELVQYWKEFYQTPERKIAILDLEKEIRNVKLDLNDLKASYNSLLNPDYQHTQNLVLQSIKQTIEEYTLKLYKLETTLEHL